MLRGAELVAFVGSRDLAVSEAFYHDVLGLEVLDRTPFAHLYAAGGSTLRVTLVAEVVTAPYTVLGWSVGDLRDTMRRLGARGAVFKRFERLDQDEARIWTAPGGARIAWFADPDGNTLSLTQPPDP